MAVTQATKEKNLDRAVALAANGRVHPDLIVDLAKKFDQHLSTR